MSQESEPVRDDAAPVAEAATGSPAASSEAPVEQDAGKKSPKPSAKKKETAAKPKPSMKIHKPTDTAPVDARSIFSLHIGQIKEVDNPRHEPENLHSEGYVLVGDPSIETPDLKKGQHVSLVHLALSENIQKVQVFVELIEKHESVDRETDPAARQSIVELAESLKQYDQIVPVLLKHGRHGWILGDGARRVAAVLYLHAKSRLQIEKKEAGAPKSVHPAEILSTNMECKSDDVFLRSVIANMARTNFSELQEGLVCYQLLKQTNPKTGKKYNMTDAARLIGMPYGTFRYRQALFHPSRNGKGLTDEERREVGAGRLNASYASKKSLGEKAPGNGPKKKKHDRPLSMKEMQDRFDQTPAHNKERRQAFAECMGITLAKAIKDSMARIDSASDKVERKNARSKNVNRRQRKAA